MTGWGWWGSGPADGTELVGDRYRLVEELGEGGMSVVWRGHDEVLGRPVAVKVLASRLLTDRAFRHRLRAEARAAARLCHPHIIGVYDYGESVRFGRTVPYVVMELVDGESLAARLDREGTLPWQDALVIGAQVAAALAAAHARGVVHRDITPGNVMLTPMGAKVVDFGISALVGERDGDADGELYGTPAYLAPERLSPGEPCSATDVYALGLLLYRMLAGRLPWRAVGRTELLQAHLHQKPAPMPPVPGLPAEVVALAARSLAKAPEERPSSAELARILAGAAGIAVPLAGPGHPEPVPSRVSADRPGPGTARLPGPADAPPFPVEVGAGHDGVTLLRPTSPNAAPPEPGRRRWTAPRRWPVRGAGRLRVAAVGVGVLALAGVVWAAGGEPSDPATDAASGPGLALGGSATCRVDYVLRADANGTFDADLIVFNLGDQPVRDWTLTFDFPGDQVLLRNPSPTSGQQGREVVLRPAAGAPETTLPAGGSVQFDLVGTHSGANPLPVEFRLGQTACAARVSGVPGESNGLAAGTAVGTLPPETAARPASGGHADARPPGPAGPAKAGPDKDGPGKGGPGKGGPGKGGPGKPGK